MYLGALDHVSCCIIHAIHTSGNNVKHFLDVKRSIWEYVRQYEKYANLAKNTLVSRMRQYLVRKAP